MMEKWSSAFGCCIGILSAVEEDLVGGDFEGAMKVLGNLKMFLEEGKGEEVWVWLERMVGEVMVEEGYLKELQGEYFLESGGDGSRDSMY